MLEYVRGSTGTQNKINKRPKYLPKEELCPLTIQIYQSNMTLQLVLKSGLGLRGSMGVFTLIYPSGAFY